MVENIMYTRLVFFFFSLCLLLLSVKQWMCVTYLLRLLNWQIEVSGFVFVNVIFNDFTQGGICGGQCFSKCSPQVSYTGITCEACFKCIFLDHLTYTKPESLGERSGNLCKDFYRSTLMSLKLKVLENCCPWNLGELVPVVPLRPRFQC